MEGHSRSGVFGEGGVQDSDDPFERMRGFGNMGGAADMFSRPAWGSFAHGGAGDSWQMDDPMDGVEAMRPRPRPKFNSASTMMGPRPFRRERRSSAGPSEPAAAESGGRERIIPIQVERDEADSAAPQKQSEQPQHHQSEQQPQQQPEQPSPRQQRPYTRRGTADTPVAALQAEQLQREARARSAPPEGDAAAGGRVPPLDVRSAAAAAAPHKPNYFNSSPKPFSAQQRPFQTPSFGAQGQIPIPVQVERGPAHHPPQHQQQPHQNHQQQQPQQQQQQAPPPPSEAKQPPPPPPKPKTPKERAMETIAAVQQRVAELTAELEVFTGLRGERQHLYLDEMLTRELLKLDNVEANGDEEIRTARKQTIMSIQGCLAQLEAKLAAPEGAAADGVTEKTGEEAEKAETPMEVAEGQTTSEVTAPAEEAEMTPAQEGAVPQPPPADASAEGGAAVQEPAAQGTVPTTAAAEETPAPASAPAEAPAEVSNSAIGPKETSTTAPEAGTAPAAPEAASETTPAPVPDPESAPAPADPPAAQS